MLGIMCCGCRLILDKAGKTTGPAEMARGFIPATLPSEAAVFQTEQEADAFAAKAGWQVRDTKGQNHRCPECLKSKKQSEARGAYVYPSVTWSTMKPFLLFLFSLPAIAATVVIDAGSAADSNFVGGTAFTIPPPNQLQDATMRFGSQFTYKIPALATPYLVTFRFVEPTVTAAGRRLFSITINGQPAFADVDVWAEKGQNQPLTKSIIIMGADQLNIIFQARNLLCADCRSNAIVSAIEATPLFEIYANHVSDLADCKVVRSSPTRLTVNAAAQSWQPCNLRVGNHIFSLNSQATVDLQPFGSAGSARIYIRYDGGAPRLEVSYQGIAQPICSGMGCQVIDTPFFPIGSNWYPLAEWIVTVPGIWDPVGTDRRALLNADGLTAGEGINVMPQPDGTQRVSIQQTLGGVRQLVWCEFVTAQQPDGSYLIAGPPSYAGAVTAVGPIIFKNGARMIGGTDFTIDPQNQQRLIPMPVTPPATTGAWLPTDAVLTEYWIVVNGGPTASSPVSTPSGIVATMQRAQLEARAAQAALRSPVVITPPGQPPLNPTFAPLPPTAIRAMRPGGPPLIPSFDPAHPPHNAQQPAAKAAPAPAAAPKRTLWQKIRGKK